MENIKKKKIGIGLLLVGITLVYLFHWFGCALDTKFFFSSLDVKLRILFDIQSDQYVSTKIAHALHNKVTQGGVDIFNTYIQFWDLRFLFMLLSPFTLGGVFLWIYFLLTSKIKFSLIQKILVVLCLFMPLPILFGLIKNEILAVTLFALPLVVVSFCGYEVFMQYVKRALLYSLILFIVSLWYILILSVVIFEFCHL